MGAFDGLPVKDVDIYEAAAGDFADLVARAERMAEGSDGSIGAASFTLASAFPFQAQGVEPGHVLVIDRAAGKPVRDGLPITSVAANSVTCGRLGYAEGKGAFPRGAGTSGVGFYVPTVVAQIRTAYRDAMRRLGLNPASTLVNADDLRLVTILMTLRGLYFAEYRQTQADTWKDKMQALDGELAGLFSGLDRTYGSLTPAGARSAIAPMDVDARWRIPSDGRDPCGPWTRWD